MLENTETTTAKPDEVAGIDTNPEGAALRSRVKAIAESNSTSFNAIAREVGVAESTFTAWLGGKYRGTNAKINEKVELWLNSRSLLQQSRVVTPEAEFAPTRTSKRILAALEYAQSMADIAVITGGPGVGKTTSILRHKSMHPNVWILTAEPSLASAYSMLEYLRETLNIPNTVPHKISRSICGKLAGTNGLIIIDESQHLKTEAFDQMRSIHDRAKIGMAFVGNEGVMHRMDGGGRKAEFAQIFSRIGKRLTVMRPSVSDIETLLDASEVQDSDARKYLKMLGQKPGALRTMVKTLRQARVVALGAEEELNVGHISATYSSFLGEAEAV